MTATTECAPARSMAEIRRRNAEAGLHWFEPGTMRFFRSRVGTTAYVGTTATWFVSSDQGPGMPRLYTVRRAMPDGNIGTDGEFQAYRTLRSAGRAAAALAAANRAT